MLSDCWLAGRLSGDFDQAGCRYHGFRNEDYVGGVGLVLMCHMSTKSKLGNILERIFSLVELIVMQVSLYLVALLCVQKLS